MKTLLVILVAFLTSVLTSAGLWYADQRWELLPRRSASQEPVPERVVPHLVGLTEEDAKANLAALDLKLMIAGREPSESAPAGSVIKQEPSGDARLPAGEAVLVTFALPPLKVPELIGLRVAEARHKIEELGFTAVVHGSTPSDEHPEGTVAQQSPAPGTALATPGIVSLTPSAGRGQVEVPKLVGLSLNNAKSLAQEANLEVAVQWVTLAETASHVVLRQTPAAGDHVKPGSEVRVVINR